jgi:hypothetical protein
MKVEIKQELKYFYRIFNNLSFKEYKNVSVSVQNYIFIEKEWYPIEDFNYIISDEQLIDPIQDWIDKMPD